MSWLFLALSVGFFFLPEFRWALALPSLQRRVNGGRISAVQAIGEDRLRRLAESARSAGDADGLAYAALYWPGPDAAEAMPLADAAVAKDPGKGWLYAHIAMRYVREKHDSPAVTQLLQRAADHDGNNAYTFLAMSTVMTERNKQYRVPRKKDGSLDLAAVAKLTNWLEVMAGAFAAEKYDSHFADRFRLERTVLVREGWVRPEVVLFSLAGYPVPGPMQIKDYADYRLATAREHNADGKHNDEVIREGYVILRFGQMMENSAAMGTESWIGQFLHKAAYAPLQQALQTAGRNDEAALLERDRLRAESVVRQRQSDLRLTTNPNWDAVVIMIGVLLTWVFAALTLLALVYVNAKRWVRPQKQGPMFRFITTAENYLPLMLFLSTYTVFLFYAPYAANLHVYMQPSATVSGQLDPLFQNITPLLGFCECEIAFAPSLGLYLYWVVVCFLAVGGAMVGRRVYARKHPPEQPGPA